MPKKASNLPKVKRSSTRGAGTPNSSSTYDRLMKGERFRRLFMLGYNEFLVDDLLMRVLLLKKKYINKVKKHKHILKVLKDDLR